MRRCKLRKPESGSVYGAQHIIGGTSLFSQRFRKKQNPGRRGRCRFPADNQKTQSSKFGRRGLARVFWDDRSQRWLDSWRRWREGRKRARAARGAGAWASPSPRSRSHPAERAHSIPSPANTYHLKPSSLCLPNISGIFYSARSSFLSSPCLSATCHNL